MRILAFMVPGRAAHALILRGHVAASRLCHRYLRADWAAVLWAGLCPDLVDKVLYYGVQAMPGSRAIMHSIVRWLTPRRTCTRF